MPDFLVCETQLYKDFVLYLFLSRHCQVQIHPPQCLPINECFPFRPFKNVKDGRATTDVKHVELTRTPSLVPREGGLGHCHKRRTRSLPEALKVVWDIVTREEQDHCQQDLHELKVKLVLGEHTCGLADCLFMR